MLLALEFVKRRSYPVVGPFQFHDPSRIAEMVRKTRGVEGYHPMAILFNEGGHFDFDKPANNMLAATGEYASWDYF